MTTLTYQPMIRGAEVWAPTENPNSLRLATSLLETPHAKSTTVVGKVVAKKSPLIDNLSHSGNGDSDEAIIGIPIVAEDQIRSVLILQVECDQRSLGAIEIWTRNSREELGLNGGVFSNLGRFAKISQFVRFPRGSGLPGQCWENRDARLIRGLGSSPNFMRASGARASGLDVGIGIPLMLGAHNLGSVLLLLSSQERPIARVFEIWDVDEVNECLNLRTHSVAQCVGAVTQNKSTAMAEGLIGQVCSSGTPIVTNDLASIETHRAEDVLSDGLTTGIAIPVYVGEKVKSVFAMLT